LNIEVSVLIGRPVEEVWRFVTDWSNIPRMNPVVLAAKQTSSGPPGVGTTVEATQEPRLGNRVTRIRVVGYEPNRRLALEHVSGPLKGTRTTFLMETVEGKTRLTLTTDAKLSGFYRVLGPFVAGRARREVGAELGNARCLLETKAQP